MNDKGKFCIIIKLWRFITYGDDGMDINLESESHVPLKGQVILHTSRDKNTSSALTITLPIVDSIAPVLEKLSECYSPIQSIVFVFTCTH